MIITGPRPAVNACARVDSANAVSAVCVITMTPSCGPTSGAKSTNCIDGTALRLPCRRAGSSTRRAPPRAGWCRCRRPRSGGRDGGARPPRGPGRRTSAEASNAVSASGCERIWRSRLVERVGGHLDSSSEGPPSLAAAPGYGRLAEHRHHPAEDPAVDHLERLDRRVLGDEHDARAVVARGASRWPRPPPGPGSRAATTSPSCAVAWDLITTRSPSRMPAPIMESPATRSAKWSALPETNACGTVTCSSTCSSARMGAPAAIRPSSGTTAPSTLGSDERHRARLRRRPSSAGPCARGSRAARGRSRTR